MEPYQRRMLKRVLAGVILVAITIFARQSGIFGKSGDSDQFVKVTNNTGGSLQLSLLPLSDSSRATTLMLAPGATAEVAYHLGDFLGLTDESQQWMERYELIGVRSLRIKPGGGRSPYVFDPR